MILANIPAFQYGTSPNKFFDYLAAGLPVLCNYPGWIANIIVEANCGIAVTPGDPVALAGALELLASQPLLVQAMGFNARRMAETTFARDNLASAWLSVLEKAALAAPASAGRR
jgi:glycosyltransferase involved in cell wall biosynthesis